MQQDTLSQSLHTSSIAEDTAKAPSTIVEKTSQTVVRGKETANKHAVLKADSIQGKKIKVENQPNTFFCNFTNGNDWTNGHIKLEKSDFLQKLDSVTGYTTTLATIKPTGITGNPVPYLFRNDNFITITLFVSFFLVVWIFSRSRYYFREQIKNFFHERERENMFSDRIQTELHGQPFLVFQTCFLLSILFFDFTQEREAEIFFHLSPYVILGTSVVLCCLYYFSKIILYSFINSIFFERRACKRFMETYLISVFALGLFLLPLTLLVVYFDLSFRALTIAFICLLALEKMMLLYKTWCIFFKYTLGWFHLFLYFCTLEIAPLFILWRTLVYVHNILLILH